MRGAEPRFRPLSILALKQIEKRDFYPAYVEQAAELERLAKIDMERCGCRAMCGCSVSLTRHCHYCKAGM